jgi:hypothetical protein
MDETDDEPWEECPVCEYNWTLKPGRDDMLRFVEHSHDKSYKGRIMPVQCEGSYHTPEEARDPILVRAGECRCAPAHNAAARLVTCARWRDQKRGPRVSKNRNIAL